MYDCSSSSILSHTSACDCSFFPDWYDCLSHYGGQLQLSSVNFTIRVHLKLAFHNKLTLITSFSITRTFISVTQTDYVVFYNTILFENSLISIMTSTTTFVNCSSFSDSEVIVVSSSVNLYETNIFSNTSSSAIKCYNSDITMSGKILFVNNTGAAKGAALALYSSSLKIVNGANLTFVNNIALHKGGAIYIEPSLSPFVYILGLSQWQPPCFYELLDCSHDSKYIVHIQHT